MSENLAQGPEEKPQTGNPYLWAMLLPFLGAAIWGVWYIISPKQDETPAATYNAFNLPEAPKNEAKPAAAPDAASPTDSQAPAGPGPGPGLAGFVPEGSGIFVRPKGGLPTTNAGEQDFLKKHDAQLKEYQGRVLSPLCQKYYKKSPIVREVDAAFGKLPRYMALVDQYNKDRDAYKWARGVIGLPEVRKTMMKYSTNVEVWKVAVQMSLEALKTPPPKPIYDEAQRFMTGDKQMAKYVGDFAMDVVPLMGTMMTRAIPPGTDIKPLQGLVTQLAPENLQAMTPKPPQQPQPAPRRK
ncbi:MAG TPA: hypothetical protein DCM05_04970 [Elusimicrobia bacterium]|nr:hypothetical protein [Elusimicrobiota bacterium]